MRQLILDIRPDAPPSFANYLPGGNLEAFLTVRAMAAGASAEAILYLWGPEGAGRTHLLRAAVGAVRTAGLDAAYLSADQSLPDEAPSLLAVDDVQGLSDVGQLALFNLINAAREGMGRILAAGDVPPARLPLRPDLATRLSWGLVYGLVPPSEADKLMALAERARARGMDLPDEVARYLLRHCRRDLPNLLAQVDALDAYSLSLKRPVSLPLLRDLLSAGSAP
ncbi:MAG: DnaA regulatory inactivator Hda [Thiobacillaceae bacterium]|jgi:DnaA family protein|nr:DnaA regulatory inactivator Hda [Thiobacillaceae bacterium]